MAQNFIACDRDQEYLLPPSVSDWLPEGHLAWFVLDVVDQLDLSAFYADYREDGHGRAAHDPQMMVALFVYAYARGERSSRLIERRLVEDVAYRVIAANQTPDHATIARFRARHEEALGGLFGEVLALCARAGLVDARTVVLDSTKLAADASGQRNVSYDELAREILAEAGRVDRAEDELYGDRRGDELPQELADPKTRRQKIKELLGELEAADRAEIEAHNARCEEHEQRRREGRPALGRPPKRRSVDEKPVRRINLTDPDSRPVRTARGFIQGYNAQAAATADQIVVCAELTRGGTDQGLLEPLAERTTRELRRAGVKERPQTLLADAGYWNARQIEAVRKTGIDVLVSPDGQARRGPPANRQPLARELRARLETEEGRALYGTRKQIIEPIFGQTKSNRGADRFLRRGLAACRSEWRLITATHNLLKLWRHGVTPAT